MKAKYLSIVVMIMLTSSIYSQNITNTLGANGSFIIKDGSETFFTLDQATGLVTLNKGITLPYTIGAATLGVINKGGTSFIHDFQGSNAYGGNTFVGTQSGNFTMNGTGPGQSSEASWNSAFGNGTLQSLTTGHHNSAFGQGALLYNTTGYDNSAFGQNALYYNTTGYNNSAFGNTALVQNTGSNNSAFGQYAGNNVTSGSNLTLIGYDAQPSAGSATNEMTLGNGIATLRCQATSITSTSDARDKKNIQNLELGIGFLMKLTPRQFNWDRREWYKNDLSDGTKMQNTPTAGFIAQELDAVQKNENAEWLNLVLKTNPNKLEATYGNLLPIMVKAIQDLKKENDLLKSKNEMFQTVNKNIKTATQELENRVNKFENVQALLISEIEKLKKNINAANPVSLVTK